MKSKTFNRPPLRISIVLLLAASIGMPGVVSAQAASADVNGPNDTGFPANAIIHGSDFDNVRINNGNLHIEIPVTSLTGRGETVIYRWVYDSKGWSFNADPNVPPPRGPVGGIIPAPTQSFRYLAATGYRVSFRHLDHVQCNTIGSIAQYVDHFGGYTLIESDGTRHPFPGSFALSVGSTGCATTTPGTTIYSADGSGWILQIGFTSGDLWPVTATSKDGKVVHFVQSGAGEEASEVDRNGNVLSGSTDTLGRPSPPTNGSYYDSTGTLQSFTVTNTTVPVQTALCGFYGLGSQHCTENHGNLTQPQVIQLPDGLTYQFTYAQNQYGQPTSVILPTGAQISWAWGNQDSGGLKVTSRKVTVGGKSFTWQYNYGFPGNAIPGNYTWVNSIIDPVGNETDFTCQYLFVGSASGVLGDPGCTPIQVQYFQGSGSSKTLIKTVATSYLTTGAILPTVVTTTWNQTNSTSRMETDWDGIPMSIIGTFRWSNPVEKREYDFSGNLMRRTDYDYLHLNSQTAATYQPLNLADFPSSVTVYDGSGHMVAQTKTGYDETAVTSTSGAPSHDYTNFGSGNNLRANATSVSHWRNTDGALLRTTHTYDDLGNPRSTTDPNGNPTTFSYNDNWASSPNNACVPAGVNTQAFVTQVTNALNQNLQSTYFPCTGFTQAHLDQNDINAGRSGTTFAYDLMNRPLAILYPDGGQTSYDYHGDALPLKATKTVAAGTDPSILTSVTRDGLGRVVQTSIDSAPGGPDVVDITYDPVGRKQTESNPHTGTPASTDGVTSYQYDALSRITQITAQDNGIFVTDYSQFPTITVTDPAGKQRRSSSDSLGRLIQVQEPGVVPTQNDYAVLQTDGNFVLYSSSNTALWASSTSSSVPALLVLQNDGNLVLYTQKWQAGTQATPAGSFPTPGCSVGTGLIVGQTLSPGKCLSSPQGQYELAMQTDGNLVLYNLAGGSLVATWSSGTAGNPGASASMQGDGNFVIYSSAGVALWASNTAGSSANWLTIEDNGQAILFGPAWSSSTSQGGWTGSLSHPGCDLGSSLVGSGGNNVLHSGSCLVSPNGRYELLVQADGNMVLYDNLPNPQTALWSSGTAVSPFAPGIVLVSAYSYDTLGNLTRVDQKGSAPNDSTQWRTRLFTYNSLSQLLTAQNPESGPITYAYDPVGNLLQKTSPQANQIGSATTTISYCYDSLNRVAAKAYTNSPGTPPSCGTAPPYLPNPAITYTYDVATNGIGHLTALTDQAGSGSYSYDTLGRVSSEQRTIAGVTKRMSYGYNLAGSLKSLTYPSGATVTYTPDAAGRVGMVQDLGNNINYVTGLTGPTSLASYAPDGSVTGFVSGNSSSFAGITNSFSFNQRLQPVNMSAASPSGTIFSLNYDFHVANGNNGNVWGITNNKDTSRSQTFGYDQLNRLSWAQNAGTDCTKTTVNGKTEYWGNSYGYDAWGNLLAKTVTKCGAESRTLTADVANRVHVTAGADYQYDSAGNMTYDAVGQYYTYDQENRITGANGFTYTYDADGNRVAKSNGSTGTLYWQMSPGTVAESDLGGTLQSEYVFFGGKRAARKDFPSLAVSYYFPDRLKTTQVVTDFQGNIKNESDFYPWGGELQFVANDSNHYKFTGKERDSETGLDLMGARYYSSGMGRFTKPDPLIVQNQKLLDPQQWNMYQYARDNPLRFTDPTGKYVCQGDKTNCATIKASLDLAKTAAGNLKEGSSERKRLEKVIEFYGEEGRKNGVVVKFGEESKGVAASTHTEGKTTVITFDMKQILRSAQNAGLALTQTAEAFVEQTVHEGEHGVYQRVHGRPTNRAEEKRDERDAYAVQSAVPMGLNMKSAYDLWDPSWDPARADGLRKQAIEDNAELSTQIWCALGGNCK